MNTSRLPRQGREKLSMKQQPGGIQRIPSHREISRKSYEYLQATSSGKREVEYEAAAWRYSDTLELSRDDRKDRE
jgi:hypothetical protein